jgi:metal-sulfur cluster biosynthetic enzyme
MAAGTTPAASAAAEVRARVGELLNEVVDPCSVAAGAPAGLVDMGLIRELEVAEGDGGLEVTVVVRVTHPSCMMAPIFLARVQGLVDELPEVSAIHASLDTGFDWTPADMTDEYRARLSRHRAAAGRGRELPVYRGP